MIQALVINFIQLTHFLNCSEQNYNKILLSVHWNNFPVTSQILLRAQMRNCSHHHQPDSGWAPESADLSKADMLSRGDNLLKWIWSLCDIVHLPRPHPGDGWEHFLFGAQHDPSRIQDAALVLSILGVMTWTQLLTEGVRKSCFLVAQCPQIQRDCWIAWGRKG